MTCRGCSNKEIADALIVTIDTVKCHVRSLLYKLNARDRTHAAGSGHSAPCRGATSRPSRLGVKAVPSAELVDPAPSMTAPAPHQQDEDVERDLLALRLKLKPDYRFANAQEVRLAAGQGWRLLVNAAGPKDWLRLPGCNPDLVDRLMRLREAGATLEGPEILLRQLAVGAEELEAWRPVLDFRCPPESEKPPSGQRLDLNRSSPELLRSRLHLVDADLRQLLAHRQRRPFRSLQDLKERLGLSWTEIEGLIGRLIFSLEQGPPSLPPTPGTLRDGGAKTRPPRRLGR